MGLESTGIRRGGQAVSGGKSVEGATASKCIDKRIAKQKPVESTAGIAPRGECNPWDHDSHNASAYHNIASEL
jgi:hypothetical protein